MTTSVGPCTRQQLPEILEILNEAILYSTALYDYKPRTEKMMQSWFDTKDTNNFPIIGVFSVDGQLLGFGSYGTFRNWPAYKYTVEHSIYVHHEHRGKGIGNQLLDVLIQAATSQNYHVMVAGIDATNLTSIALHTKKGFHHAGTILQAGYKFGRWLDLAFYQLVLSTPMHPIEE